MKPEGALRDEYVDELLEVEKKLAKLKDQLKDQSKALRSKIGDQEARRDELLDLLSGKEHDQPDLPMARGEKTGARGPGLSVAMAANGFGVPPGEVREAKEELNRKAKAKRAGDDAIDVTPRPGQKALPPKRGRASSAEGR